MKNKNVQLQRLKFDAALQSVTLSEQISEYTNSIHKIVENAYTLGYYDGLGERKEQENSDDAEQET